MKQQDDLKESIYYVKGMHCPSCELLIEKELLKKKNIESVEASTSRGKVVIFYQGVKPSINELNKKFEKAGYTFSQEPVVDKKKEQNKLLKNSQIIGIALLLALGFLLLNRTAIASRVAVSSTSALWAFFLFGLIAGISSCAALVGGIILSMSKQWAEIYLDGSSDWQKFQPHFLFNIGRLLSFAFFGAMLGALGALLQISLAATSFLAIAVSFLMVLLALQMLGIKYFQKFQITMPKFISRYVADETHFKGRYMPFFLGASTFFLPCGFTITAQGLALASGSSLRGALIMFTFALGTLPMLTAIGFSSLKLTAKPHLSDKFLKVAGILVLFFGLYTLNAQLNVLGLPSLNDVRLNLSTTSQFSEDGFPPIVNGKQLLKMDALAYGYEPNEFMVRAGIPVRWEIENKGVSGCTNAIVSKGLFAGEIRLDGEASIKEFTPEKPGKYKFSCWMGMISGIINVVDENGSANEVLGVEDEEIPSGAYGCGGTRGGSCTGGCGGGCGNPNCPYAE